MRLPRVGPEGEPVESAFVADLCRRRLDGGVGIALVAIGLAHALGVFVELGGVEGAGKEVLKDDESTECRWASGSSSSGAGRGC